MVLAGETLDVSNLDQVSDGALFDADFFQVPELFFETLQVRPRPRESSFQSPIKALEIKGFQEKIAGIFIEGADSEFVVSGLKDQIERAMFDMRKTSNPFRPGISMSRNKMSGVIVLSRRKHSEPLAASWISYSAPRKRLMRLRASSASSTMRISVMGRSRR